jgi:hypothetical protein
MKSFDICILSKTNLYAPIPCPSDIIFCCVHRFGLAEALGLYAISRDSILSQDLSDDPSAVS